MASQFLDLDCMIRLKFTQTMALRVLLADESNAIKKVFQLALQDFAVNVRSVNLGPDVLDTARNFKPDIIFADVLLQKKNGYDVASDLKADKSLRETPVVLMWSGFMELDQDKFQASRADGKLEKPFDVEALRHLVRSHVPKTKSQDLSQYLSFPKMPDFQEDESEVKKRAQTLGLDKKSVKVPEPRFESKKPSPSTVQERPDSQWNMESFDPIDQFEERPISEQTEYSADSGDSVDLDLELGEEKPDQQWIKKDISQFRVDPKVLSDATPGAHYVVPEEDLSQDLAETFENSFGNKPSSMAAPPPIPDDGEVELEGPVVAAQSSVETAKVGLSQDAIEKIVRETVQDAVWKIVPELARELIEKELHRLLAEEKNL